MKSFQNQLSRKKNSPLLFLFYLSFFLCSTLSFADSKKEVVDPTSITLDEQIALMDAEILLLKAELALQNNAFSQVESYLKRVLLIKDILYPSMLKRFSFIKSELSAYLKQHQLSQSSPQNTTLEFKPDLSSIAVLLPQTGNYGDAGNAIIDGIVKQSEELENLRIRYFDTNAYESMFELWELVKLYSPSLVIGPLVKQKAIDLNQLNINVPTLYLNKTISPRSYTRFLGLNRTEQVGELVDYLNPEEDKKIAVLFSKTEKSINLKDIFIAKWQSEFPELQINNAFIILEEKESIDQSMEKLLNADLSQNRNNWLQSVVETPLIGKERTRQDIDAIVSFLPAVRAGQIKPMLQYYQLSYINHLWFPSQLPSVNSFRKRIHYWQDTYAILPSYFVDKLQTVDNAEQLEEKEELGIFYALGKLVADVVLTTESFNSSVLDSSLGYVVVDEKYQITIKPKMVRIHKGSVQ